MIPAQRHSKIIQLLKENGTVQVSKLSKSLNVSELTIRRDLDHLAAKNILTRSFGGATINKVTQQERSFNSKSEEQANEKKAIALEVNKLIDDKDVLYINSGSTTLEVIKLLSDRDVTIVTNNIDSAHFIKENSKCKLILLGGIYRSQSHSVSGSLTSYILDTVNATKAIIGVDGISLNTGLTTPILEEAETTREMVKRCASNIICVASSNKIGCIRNYKTVDSDTIDVLVTDISSKSLLDEEQLKEMEIKVVYAKPQGV